MKKSILPYILGVVSSLIFGLSFIFVKSGLEEAEPFVILTYRFFFAFIIFTLLIIFKVIKVNFKNKKILPLITIGLVTPVIDIGAETTALKYITTIEAAIYLSLVPILVMIFSTIFLKEKSTLLQKIFVITSVVGALICIEFTTNHTSGSILGTVLIIIGITCCATYSILARKLVFKYSAAEITYSMIIVGSISFFILAVFTKTDTMYNTFVTVLINKQFVISFIYLSLGCSVIAFLINNYMYSKITATNTSVFTNLITVITIIAGVVVLDETISNQQVLGAILIITGVIGTNYIEYKKR